MPSEVESVARNLSPFLPIESLQHGMPTYDYPDWNDWLTRLCDTIDKHNAKEEQRRHLKWLTCENFFQDRQVGQYNHRGEWEAVEYDYGDPIYVCNFFQYFVRSIVKEVVRANAKIEIKPIISTIRRRAAARLYDASYKQIQKDNWTASEKEREAKQLVLRGNSIRRIRPGKDYDKLQLIPVTQMVEKSLGLDVFVCVQCLEQGDATMLEGANHCPSCGGRVGIMRKKPVQAEEIVRYDAQPETRVDIDTVDTFAIKFNLHARSLETSDYLRYSAMIGEQLARYYFPWANYGLDAQRDSGQQAMLNLQRSAGNWDGGGYDDSDTSHDELVSYREYYLEPSRYCHYEFPRDTQMAGVTVRKGERMLKYFPRGAKIVRLAGLVVDVQPCGEKCPEKNQEFVQIQWDQLNTTAWGAGAGERMIEPQRASNEMMSLWWEILLTEASALTLVNQNKIDPDQIVFKSGYVGTMRQQAGMESPGSYIWQSSPRSSRPDLVQALEANKSNFQLLSGGTFSTDGALSDIDGQTATGISIIREQAMANLAPSLAQIAEADVRTTKIVMRWIKELDLGTQYVKRRPEYAKLEYLGYLEYGPEHFEISYAEGSYMPQIESEKRNSFIAARAQGFLDPSIPKGLQKRIAATFNQPLEDDEISQNERYETLKLIDLIAFAEKGAELRLDEEHVAQVAATAVPVDAAQDHEVAIGVLMEFLLTDEAVEPLLRRLLWDRIRAHQQAQTLLAQSAQVQQIEANAPAAMMAAQGSAQNRTRNP